MTKSKKFYLDCPYSEKDQAKDMGARWDVSARKWYVPDGIDREQFRKWWPSVSRGKEDVTDVPTFR